MRNARTSTAGIRVHVRAAILATVTAAMTSMSVVQGQITAICRLLAGIQWDLLLAPAIWATPEAGFHAPTTMNAV